MKHQFYPEQELLKLSKSELIGLFGDLQDYARRLEEQELAAVTVSLDTFYGVETDFLPELQSFLSDISLVEMSDTRPNGWAHFRGRVVSRFRIESIGPEIGRSQSNSHWTKTCLIPEKMVQPLTNFLHALDNEVLRIRKEADEQGKNLLIQQLRHDVIGAI